MAVWVVKAGRQGEFEQSAVINNIVGIDFGLRGSINEFPNRDALRQHLQRDSAANQLWRFANGIQIGETVIMPFKQTQVVAAGRISGEYRYETGEHPPHIRSVEWAATDIPRSSFDQDLLYSFGGLSTVFQVNRLNAQERIERVVREHLGEVSQTAQVSETGTVDEEVIVSDLDVVILDRIAQRIRERFTGHRLEYLVESILKAKGYTTLQTRRGADGGIDVVAGKGEMGFGGPRLCVQVKSGMSPVDLPEYDRLLGNVQSFGADHGLLVSLSDFTRPVRNRNESSFFQIRLWGAAELTEYLRETYDELPADIRTEVPLVDRKMLAETDA